MATLLLCNYNFHQVLPIPNSQVLEIPISPRSSFNQVGFFSSGYHSSTTRNLKMAQTTQNPGHKIHHLSACLTKFICEETKKEKEKTQLFVLDFLFLSFDISLSPISSLLKQSIWPRSLWWLLWLSLSLDCLIDGGGFDFFISAGGGWVFLGLRFFVWVGCAVFLDWFVTLWLWDLMFLLGFEKMGLWDL